MEIRIDYRDYYEYIGRIRMDEFNCFGNVFYCRRCKQNIYCPFYAKEQTVLKEHLSLCNQPPLTEGSENEG